MPLADPDGDGLYTGSTTVDRFGSGPGPVPPGIEPLSFPVLIVQGTGVQGRIPGQPVTVIREFGAVAMQDRTFRASVSFEDGQYGQTPSGATRSGGRGASSPIPAAPPSFSWLAAPCWRAAAS